MRALAFLGGYISGIWQSIYLVNLLWPADCVDRILGAEWDAFLIHFHDVVD